MEVQGFPDYLIYPDGRVLSKKSNKFMKQSKKRNNYYCIKLYGHQEKLIHKLVAEHYIPNPENKPEVDHKNRNRQDNRVENLRWATRKENANNQGLYKSNTSGHKWIMYKKSKKRWIFNKVGVPNRYFKTKIDAIHYKFYYLLKINLLKKTLLPDIIL